MRHRKKVTTLGRGANHRRALMRNLARAFFINGSIMTTEAKAKAIKPTVEKLITMARQDTLHSRRKIIQAVGSNAIAEKIIKEISPRYKERAGGYTRIVKIGTRAGDNAKKVYLELI